MIPFPEPPLPPLPPNAPKWMRENRDRERKQRQKEAEINIKLAGSFLGTIFVLGFIVLLRYEILPAAMAATWAQIINYVAWLALAGVIFATIWKAMNWLLRD